MTKTEIDRALAPPFCPFLLTSGEVALVVSDPKDYSISGETLELHRPDGALITFPFSAIASIDPLVH